jgi:hypothetical protein
VFRSIVGCEAAMLKQCLRGREINHHRLISLRVAERNTDSLAEANGMILRQYMTAVVVEAAAASSGLERKGVGAKGHLPPESPYSLQREQVIDRALSKFVPSCVRNEMSLDWGSGLERWAGYYRRFRHSRVTRVAVPTPLMPPARLSEQLCSHH